MKQFVFDALTAANRPEFKIDDRPAGLSWPEMRRDVFAILLMCLDGCTVPDAVAEADDLIRMLDTGELGKTDPQ